MTAPRYLEFIYTGLFERTRQGILDEDALLDLEGELLHDPRKGRVERGTGGVRKMRVAAKGHGKSGGARVLYLYQASVGRVFLLFVYPKTKQAMLTPEQRAVVRRLVSELQEE